MAKISTTITLENFMCVMQAPHEQYHFVWGHEESGIYNGKPYYRPGFIHVETPELNHWIKNIHEEIKITQGGENRYSKGTPVTDEEHLLQLEEYFQLLLASIKESTIKPKAIKKPKIKAEDIERFLALLQASHNLFPEKVAAFRIAIIAAIKNPTAYFTEHSDDFKNRGIEQPCTDLYVYVLLDGLDELKMATALDWKSEPEDIYWTLQKISGENDLNPGPADSQEQDAESTLTEVAKQLVLAGKQLLQWQMDEDTYYMLVAKKTEAAYLIRAAECLKIVLTPWMKG